MYAKKLPSGKGKKLIFSDDFYSDHVLEDMLYALTVRSPFAFGKLISVELPQNMPECKDVELFTYRDIPGKKTVSTLNLETPLFCDGTIH